jgi:DNA primase
MISPTTIDHVRDLPIEQVIAPYVELKKAGARYKACCPLHNEKTPSMVVTPNKNSFHCYGCGKGGDGIAFVMEKENLPFYEAVKAIAAQHGIEVQETTDKQTPEQKNDLQTMLALLTQAQEIYRTQLI